jgi:hypothetical protein
VQSRGDGRLDRITIATRVRLPPERIATGLANAESWRSLPGFASIAIAAPGGAETSARRRWEVDSTLPLVDFDAVWDVTVGPPFRAHSAGDWKGAALGWDVFPVGRPAPAPSTRASTATFTLHPRLDQAGYGPRKFIEAEPLLEHGLALGLAYVDALSLLRGLEGPQ